MTKNGSSQVIPLVDPLIDHLKVRRQLISSEWVFPSDSSSGHYTEPKKGWRIILERATVLRVIAKLAARNGWSDTERSRAESIAISMPRDALSMYSDAAEQLSLSVKPMDMRDIRVHDLRRTLGSWQAHVNVSLPIIGRTLNHKSPQSTNIYARLSLDPVRTAMTSAAEAMLGQTRT